MLKSSNLPSFHDKLEDAKRKKKQIYWKMKRQAKLPGIKSRYKKELEETSDIDTEIFD
jgi:hypothetical protein